MVDDLDRMLLESRAELEVLEQAVCELPGVMERKFCQHLSVVVSANQYLALEAAELRRQMAPALSPSSFQLGWGMRMGQVFKQQSRHLLVVAMLSAMLSVGAFLGLQQKRSVKSYSPTSRSDVRPLSQIRDKHIVSLRASAPSWVEVQDLATRKTVLVDVIQPGNPKTVLLGTGLRLRSGRPDLLSVQFDNREPEPFGEGYGLDWRVIKP